MAEYFRVLGVEARKRYDAELSADAAAAEIRARLIRRLDRARAADHGRRRLVSGMEWQPDDSAALVREATIEYNAVRAKGGKTEAMIPWRRIEAGGRSVNVQRGIQRNGSRVPSSVMHVSTLCNRLHERDSIGRTP